MTVPSAPRQVRYGTLIDTVTRPDGSTTTVVQDRILLVDSNDENDAAHLAVNAYLERTRHRPPVGSTVNVHVFQHPNPHPDTAAPRWTIDIYIDAEDATLH